MSAHAARQFAGALEQPDDDDRNDPYEAETPEPCRGCGSIHCDSECAAYREWLTVAWLAVDAARSQADGAGAA